MNSYHNCMECGGKMKMKKGGWIQKAIKHPGSFTKQAQAAGMSVSAFRNKVLANKSAYSSTTVRRANLAKTLSRMRKGEEGMEVGPKNSSESSRLTTVPYTENMGFDKAVSDFQATPETTDVTPVSQLPTVSAPGTNGLAVGGTEAVAKYQKMLNEKYGTNLKVDGAWGPKTQAAYEMYVLKKGTTPKFEKAVSDFRKLPAPSDSTPNVRSSLSSPMRSQLALNFPSRNYKSTTNLASTINKYR